jgi:hypothetical protein
LFSFFVGLYIFLVDFDDDDGATNAVVCWDDTAAGFDGACTIAAIGNASGGGTFMIVGVSPATIDSACGGGAFSTVVVPAIIGDVCGSGAIATATACISIRIGQRKKERKKKEGIDKYRIVVAGSGAFSDTRAVCIRKVQF